VPLKPSELLLQLEVTPGEAAVGAARMGWPPLRDSAPCWPHPRARPLDRDAEPPPEGAALLGAFERVSEALFDPADAKVAVFQFSLESFRADDLHALNPAAAPGLDPFVNGLYEGPSTPLGTNGVLASRKMFQAGVRSAQGVAAMTCGVGTLPYNLSIIRDLDAFPLRCAPDLLAEAGFHGTFFYGSGCQLRRDVALLERPRRARGVSQDELPRAWRRARGRADGLRGVRRGGQARGEGAGRLAAVRGGHVAVEPLALHAGRRISRPQSRAHGAGGEGRRPTAPRWTTAGDC